MAAIRSGSKLGRGMGFFMIGGEFGYGVGPLVAVATVSLLTLRGLPWLIIFGVLCSIILFTRFQPVTTVRPAQSGPAVSLWQTLKSMRRIMLPIVAHIFITSFLYANLAQFPAHLPQDRRRITLFSPAGFITG